MPASKVALDDARALGVEHAQDAASWAFDGNSDRAERARVLDMMRDGDPAAWDYLPAQPNLSGEWADSLTPRSLAAEVIGPAWEEMEDDEGSLVTALADAYEDGVSEVFGPACEAALVEFCGDAA
jgi:hypothetical protein